MGALVKLHTYDLDSRERWNALLALVVPSLLVAYGIFVIAEAAGLSLLWWIVGVPSPLGVMGVLFLLLERWGWRSRWVRTLLRIETPDISGKWTGDAESAGLPKEDIEILIEQTWMRMLVRAETAESRSASQTASLLLVESNNPILVYTYMNQPKSAARETMHAHQGTSTCYLDLREGRLDGEYYTGRDRKTQGILTLRRVE